MRVEIIDDLADLARLREEWRSLCSRARRATPFQSPEWLIPWCSAFLEAGEPRALAVFTDDRLLRW